jgi:hypothetical protein
MLYNYIQLFYSIVFLLNLSEINKNNINYVFQYLCTDSNEEHFN